MTLQEITGENRAAVLALRVAPGQERFVSSVEESLAAAADYPQANPWYRAVFASGEPGPVGFVMLSWNCEPQPPEIIGPWFLWKLLIDQRYQGRGYATAVVRQVAELVQAEGATELLTSYAPEDDWVAGFCQRLGFVPTGEHDNNGEVIVAAQVALGVVLPASANETSRVRAAWLVVFACHMAGRLNNECCPRRAPDQARRIGHGHRASRAHRARC